jgi:hypothetical protein
LDTPGYESQSADGAVMVNRRLMRTRTEGLAAIIDIEKINNA